MYKCAEQGIYACTPSIVDLEITQARMDILKEAPASLLPCPLHDHYTVKRTDTMFDAGKPRPRI